MIAVTDGQPCEKFDLKYDLLNDFPELAAFYENYRETFEYLSNHSGLKLSENNICGAISIASVIYNALLFEVKLLLLYEFWRKTKVY